MTSLGREPQVLALQNHRAPEGRQISAAACAAAIVAINLSPLCGSIRGTDFQRVAQSFRRIAVGHDSRVIDLNIDRTNFAQYIPKSRSWKLATDDGRGDFPFDADRVAVLASV